MKTQCLDRWIASQEVYCQLEAGHKGMHESDAENDRMQVHLWWGLPEEEEPECQKKKS